MTRDQAKTLAKHDQDWAEIREQKNDLAVVSQKLSRYLKTGDKPALDRAQLEAALKAVDLTLDHSRLLEELRKAEEDALGLTMGVSTENTEET